MKVVEHEEGLQISSHIVSVTNTHRTVTASPAVHRRLVYWDDLRASARSMWRGNEDCL